MTDINTKEILEDAYEKLTLRDNFMFGKIMESPENCVPMVERLTGNTLGEDIIINREKTVKIAVDGKGVRYDVYVQDSVNSMYDTEMQQQENRLILPKRSRFYEELMDLGYLESGAEYTMLPDSYVIFICTFDPFDEGLYCYSFENVCVNMPDGSTFKLNDGRRILMFNTKGTVKNVSDEVVAFLSYLEDGIASDAYTENLDKSVSLARRNKEWRAEYMKNICHDMDMKRIGREEGREEGRIEGREEGYMVGYSKAQLELARNMKLEDAPIDFIARVTGLSIEDIERF